MDFHRQMEMVSHDHLGMHAPAVTLRRFTQGAFKPLSSPLPPPKWVNGNYPG